MNFIGLGGKMSIWALENTKVDGVGERLGATAMGEVISEKCK